MGSFSLLLGNCLDVLSTLPESSVQCCVTSPPYWGLRDYGTAKWEGGDVKCDHSPEKRGGRFATEVSAKQASNTGSGTMSARECPCGAIRIDAQLGLEETPVAYVENMVAVFRAVRRVLRDDGTLWLNLGDSYSGAAGGNNRGEGAGGGKERGKAMGFGTLPKRKDLEGGLKHKDLAGIPWRVAFALQADGWWLRQDIIWHKPNPMPESVTDRCTKSHEYIFLLTKSAKYFYDSEAVKERGAMVAGDSAGSSQRDTQETHGLGGGNSGINLAKQKLAAELQENGYSMRNKRSVWTVTIKPFKGAHFATFPPDLIEPCILAGSAPNTLVLDPFNGAGTTGVVAVQHGRRYIGIELNPEYLEMSRKRIQRTIDGTIMPLF